MACHPSCDELMRRAESVMDESARLHREIQDSIARMSDLVRERHALASGLRRTTENTLWIMRSWPAR